jgi:hypothetical protein
MQCLPQFMVLCEYRACGPLAIEKAKQSPVTNCIGICIAIDLRRAKTLALAQSAGCVGRRFDTARSNR